MAKKAKQDEPNGEPEQATPAGDETVTAYFRRIFDENPKLLNSRSNDELFKRWLADHPGETEVPKNVKGNLSNVKSVLRSQGRKRKATKAAKADAADSGAQKVSRPVPAKSKLEALEEQIDDCLTSARALDREGLEDVILHLRRARNLVVWKMGQ